MTGLLEPTIQARRCTTAFCKSRNHRPLLLDGLIERKGCVDNVVVFKGKIVSLKRLQR